MKTEKFLFAQVSKIAENGELDAVASTGALDRQGEIIEPGAWANSLPAYRENPVILATHLHRLTTGDSPVIGSVTTIDVDGEALTFHMRFAETDLGKQYASLYRDSHMRAFSVGFAPISGEWRDLNRGAGAAGGEKRVWVHTEVELWEISAVPVPANPEALARMRELEALANMPEARQVTQVAKEALAFVVKAEVAGPLNDLQSAIRDLQSEIRDSQHAIERAAAAHLDELLALFPESLLNGADEPDAPARRERPGSAGAGADGGDVAAAVADALGRAAKSLKNTEEGRKHHE